MISSVQDYAVSYYFNPDGQQRFFIPKYQREYVWKQGNWEALFNDVDDSPPGHFLGSIICVNKQKDAMAGGALELIDGQQRFTTISLLLCALYQKLKSIVDPDDDLMVELVNLKNRIFVKGTNNWRFEPSEQQQNRTDFQKILSELFPKQVPQPKGLKNFGNRRIARAYYYFEWRLKDLTLAQAQAFLEKLKAAVLVKIEVPSHSDAFILFETINNRGIPLSAIDIIKNNLLAELDRKPNYGIDRAFEEWTELVDHLPESDIQERFLRQLYNMFKYLKLVEVKGCFRATRSNLIFIYDTLLRRRPVWLFRQLRDKAKLYSALLDPDEALERWDEKTSRTLQDLQRLGAAPAYAFLVWTSQVAQSRGWKEGEAIQQVAEFLTRWFFWRNLTDTPPTRELDPLFMNIVGDVLPKVRSGEIVDLLSFVLSVRAWLKAKAPSAEACDASLNGDLYIGNYDATRFLLCKLEEAHQTLETNRNLWVQDQHGRPLFTIEHILPKTENLSESWIKMIGNGDADKAEEVRQRCAHRIGNLTLSGYNSRLGTMAFPNKRDRRNESGSYIGYRNGLYLNASLASREEWNEVAIQERSNAMIAEVKSILGLEEA